MTNLKSEGGDSIVYQQKSSSNSSSPVGLAMVDMDSLDLDDKSVSNEIIKSQAPFGFATNF